MTDISTQDANPYLKWEITHDFDGQGQMFPVQVEDDNTPIPSIDNPTWFADIDGAQDYCDSQGWTVDAITTDILCFLNPPITG